MYKKPEPFSIGDKIKIKLSKTHSHYAPVWRARFKNRGVVRKIILDSRYPYYVYSRKEGYFIGRFAFNELTKG